MTPISFISSFFLVDFLPFYSSSQPFFPPFFNDRHLRSRNPLSCLRGTRLVGCRPASGFDQMIVFRFSVFFSQFFSFPFPFFPFSHHGTSPHPPMLKRAVSIFFCEKNPPLSSSCPPFTVSPPNVPFFRSAGELGGPETANWACV